MAIRVLLLTQWFDPEPAIKGLVFAKALVQQGFDVEVVTGFPNYPGGKLYPGYKVQWLQREYMDGIAVTRLPLYPSHDQSATRRIFNYVSFSVSAAIYGLFFARKADVVYAYHPPLTVGVAAGLVRLFRRTPLVYDIQDMWPESLSSSGMLTNKRALGIVEMVCQWVYRRADKIVVLSPGFKHLLSSRNVPLERIEVIYNWCDEDALGSSAKKPIEQRPRQERFNILFAGNIGKAQGLESVLDAASTLQDRHPEIHFTFLGAGVEVEPLKLAAKQMQLRNVSFLPRVPMSEVAENLTTADALLVHLKNDPLYRITIPSKTQAYMSIGKPILMAVPGDASDLVMRARCGVSAQSEDPKSIAEAAIALAKMPKPELGLMGLRARNYYLNELSLKAGTKRFGELFRTLAGKSL